MKLFSAVASTTHSYTDNRNTKYSKMPSLNDGTETLVTKETPVQRATLLPLTNTTLHQKALAHYERAVQVVNEQETVGYFTVDLHA